MGEDTVTVSLISVSDAAAEQIRNVLAGQQRTDGAVRVFIAGRTDTGFQYGLALADGPDDDDVLVESNGVRLVVDTVSAPLLSGASLEYVDAGDSRGFAVVAAVQSGGGGCGGNCSCGRGGCGRGGA